MWNHVTLGPINDDLNLIEVLPVKLIKNHDYCWSYASFRVSCEPLLGRQDLKGSIRVFCRVRPLSKKAHKGPTCGPVWQLWDVDDDGDDDSCFMMFCFNHHMIITNVLLLYY